MLRRHKHSWSHNELFAHKKNTGEQARLRDAMLRIDQKFGLVKESIRQEASQVRTSLKCLRKSTGHSIEALPPTPFQLSTGLLRSDTFATIQEPSCDTRGSNKCREFEYLMDEIDDNSVSNNKEHPDEIRTPGENGHTYDENINRSEIRAEREHTFKTDSLDHDYGPNESQQNKKEGYGWSNSSAVFQTPQSNILPLVQQNEFLIKTKQGSGQNDYLQHEANGREKMDKRIRDENKINCIARPSSNRDDYLHTQQTIPMDCDYGDKLALKAENDNYLSLGSKENTTITNSSSHRRFPSSLGTTNLSSTDTHHTFHNAVERSKDSKILQRRKDVQNRIISNKRQNQSDIGNTRTRCRTCLERYRQNLEFRRQKRLLEEEDARQNQDTGLMSTNARSANHPQQESFLGGVQMSFLAKDEDLNSLFAESEVLDFEEPPAHLAYRKKPQGPAKKGYSKVRLEQLAEPRKGRRKKVLFSKHLIKKEVDALTERHSQPHLTEKEKERVRILESKIRMFLAVTSAGDDVMPSGMVHIPQREDIMRVDISHL